MIVINLLPRHLRPIKRTPLPYILSGLFLLLVILASASVWLTTEASIANKKNIYAEHKKEMDALQDVVNESNDLVKKKIQLKAKTDTIQEIVRDRIIWSRQLWNLARLAPENLWYDGVSVETVSKQQTREVIEETTDPTTKQKVKKTVQKQETVQVPVLKVSGSVIPGADGANDVSPLLLVTEKDPEFAAMFKIDDQEVKNEVVDGRQTKHFVLSFVILSGGAKK
ncbi:MAG: hypothetical protein HZB26_03290 [Candidatus Hydrogenedentes bacterium]|nr:hypothetical protein [Candidatus Hydrogenedentota bacterium]